MSKRNKSKILTETHAKLMIRDGELQRVFNRTDLETFFNLINKIRDFDEREGERKNAE